VNLSDLAKLPATWIVQQPLCVIAELLVDIQYNFRTHYRCSVSIVR